MSDRDVPIPPPVDPQPEPAPEASPAVTLDHAQLAAFQGGSFGLPAGARVHVRIGGKLGTVPVEQLQETAARPDFALASAHEVHAAEVQQKYGDALGQLTAGGAGLARGALAGLSDPLIVGVAEHLGGGHGGKLARETLEGVKEANPITSNVAELAGAVAPLAVGDAAGAAAEGVRGVGSISRGINALGELAGRGAEAVVGKDAPGFLARLGQSAVREGANAGVQTALQSVGNQFSEDTLGDTDTNGEKLWMAAGHGFLMGAAGGGLLASTGEIGREVLGRAAPKLQEIANEQYVRALNPRVKYTRAIEEKFGGVEPIADRIKKEKIVEAGDKIDDIAAKAEAAQTSAADELRNVTKQVGVDNVPLTDVLDPLTKRAADFAKDANGAAAEKAVLGLRDRLEDLYNPLQKIGYNRVTGAPIMGRAPNVTVSFDELLRQRRLVEKDLNWLADPAGSRGLKSAGRTIEEALVNAGDKIAASKNPQIGSMWKDSYLAAKKRYHEVAMINEITDDAMGRGLANRVISPSDYGVGVGALAGGLAAHGLAGGLHGVALGVAHHVMRERGNSTAAVLLDKLTAMGGIANAVKRVDNQIARGIKNAVFRTGVAKVRDLPFGKGPNSHDERVASVMRAMQNPDGHADDIATSVNPIAEHAPMIANGYQRSALTATAALASAVPKGQKPTPSITPQFDRERTSAVDRDEFERVHSLTHDPVGHVFSRIDKGQLTNADVQLFGKLAPKTLQQVQTGMRNELATLKKPLPYARQLQIETLLGVPDEGQAVGQILQQAIGPTSPPMGGHRGQMGAPKRQLKIAGANALVGQHMQ